MSTDDSNQGNNNIILYIVRCTGEKSEDSLTEQTEIVFRANQEINNINNYFLYLKKIKGPPQSRRHT